jgi:hypothetical protein
MTKAAKIRKAELAVIKASIKWEEWISQFTVHESTCVIPLVKAVRDLAIAEFEARKVK